MISRRLDRGLCDDNWRLNFPEATVEHLVRRKSDHNPLLLRCTNNVSVPSGRPFRFLAAWCTHEEYPDIVRGAWWSSGGSVSNALKNVRNESIIFNKNVFGNIFHRKKSLEARLKGIQRALENIDCASLYHL